MSIRRSSALLSATADILRSRKHSVRRKRPRQPLGLPKPRRSARSRRFQRAPATAKRQPKNPQNGPARRFSNYVLAREQPLHLSMERLVICKKIKRLKGDFIYMSAPEHPYTSIAHQEKDFYEIYRHNKTICRAYVPFYRT